MNSAHPPHPGEEIMLRFLDEDLPPADARLLESHLGVCSACRAQVDEIRRTIGAYLQFHQIVLKPMLPPAPVPWGRLELRSTGAPAGVRRRLFSLPSRRWLAAAAAVVMASLLALRFARAPEVKAAELLHKATAAQRSAPAHRHAVRIRTRKYQWDRAARLPAKEPAEIRQLLESAGYSWDDPLSAGAFAQWHDRLPGKQDQVETVSGKRVMDAAYVIHTVTMASTITDASLTLRAADLHAVACTLRFGSMETVEMTEVPDEPTTSHAQTERPAPVVVPPGRSAVPAQPAGPGDELRALAALHRIGADLGEPIDVKREGSNVLVNMTGLDPRREGEIRAALSGIPAVRVRSGEFTHHERREVESGPAPQVDTANTLLAELQAVSPNAASTAELGDQLNENSEKLIVRVYALRGLGRRFPAAAVANMTAAETAMLYGIIRDHAEAAASSAVGIRSLLAPILPWVTPEVRMVGAAWQDISQALPADTRTFDQALNATPTPDDPAGRKLRAAQALADIDERLARLRMLIPR